MDFLDPRRFRRHKIRLIIGYILVAIAITLGTIVLVYGAYGYGINTKTGDIVQNGLLFVDSKPGGAQIFLNNKYINQNTSARLVLPAKQYDLLIKKSGYREWERKFTLDEHTISRYVYPFLFPNKSVTSSLKTYQGVPQLFMQSPDRHWILVQQPEGEAKTVVFDEFDAGDFTKPSIPLTLPSSLLTKSAAPTVKLTEVEWSTDNTHVLLRHDLPDGSYEFIILDRNDPVKSVNVNKVLAINPTQAVLRDKKANQLYIYMKNGGTLQIADMGRPELKEPILKNILAFKPYGSNLLSYVRINIYKDPLNDIRNTSLNRAVPIMALRAQGADKVGFSDNARFIELEGGQNFGVYDIETGDEYQYSLKEPINAPLKWMDGHRLIGNSNGSVFVMDYDSTNKQILVSTSTDLGGFFSREYDQMYTLAPISGASTTSLQRVDMRAGEDLPKNP
jgi:hypothetical protein